MFKNTFQSGFLSILYSIGSKPLQIWDKEGVLDVVCAVEQMVWELVELWQGILETWESSSGSSNCGAHHAGVGVP